VRAVDECWGRLVRDLQSGRGDGWARGTRGKSGSRKVASNVLLSRAELSVAVVGGGIGGLAAALALLHAGFDVQVFEQAAALGETA
jgi:NADPH-dependent 2,4-dienoyl-CoA reductase/sulfur reductase-like enzyme